MTLRDGARTFATTIEKRFQDVELGFHVDAYIDDLVRAGIDRTEAKRRTRIEFGPLKPPRTNAGKPGDFSGWTSFGRTSASPFAPSAGIPALPRSLSFPSVLEIG